MSLDQITVVRSAVVVGLDCLPSKFSLGRVPAPAVDCIGATGLGVGSVSAVFILSTSGLGSSP